MKYIDLIISFITQFSNAILISSILTLLGGVIIGLRAHRSWVGRSFFERVSVSLNYVVDGEFKIRTLQEQPCVDVFHNASMVKKVMKAARRQHTEGILNLPENEYWYFLNPVLNSLSEKFATGFVQEESGKINGKVPAYLMFLTGGQNKQMRQRKVRALLIREQLLLDLDEMEPKFKNEFHKLRWETLIEARKEWVQSQGKTKRIREISLPV